MSFQLYYPVSNFIIQFPTLLFFYSYRDFNHPIGSLTEYYKFNAEDTEMVLRDLQQMQPKVLSLDEIDILEENTNWEQIAV
ncbi:hypothetical protein LC613_38885 [Nostoc sphaeroides CHAB 2801]|uniref:hypothetical protein n=1 Tax=Nostoc sphaeroides TaxID=446679 RepID=UPI001E4CCCE0|nr:hypothetical protein [Nostoc sphaeroides]MCC5633434.1 hypothetical protein [Nostoc sphaeroides CHAB 2801]